MIKRTLYFGNPAYLSLTNGQMIVKNLDLEKSKNLSEHNTSNLLGTIPVEDIGLVVVDNSQITFTHGIMTALLENNAAILICDQKHLPAGLMLPMVGSHTMQETFRYQIESGAAIKKNLWQQTIMAKINNQATLLEKNNIEVKNMRYWAKEVKSGDKQNHEARAAAFYWSKLFKGNALDEFIVGEFRRNREGDPPNSLLNYGYSILRAIVARALISSGLLPISGIHHKNKYNPFCLADDIMEPYRPYVDKVVLDILRSGKYKGDLDSDSKKTLLGLPVLTVKMGNHSGPLMVCVSRTTASLARCFSGEQRKIAYPEF